MMPSCKIRGFKCLILALNPNQIGWLICLTRFQKLIPLESKVGLTSNQFINMSCSLSKGLSKKVINFGHGGILKGPYKPRVP